MVHCAKKQKERCKVADEKEEEGGVKRRVREFIHKTGDGILER